MIRNNLILDLNDETIEDNFAGGGGASTGIEWALGRHVDVARNHAYEALGMHRMNHPQTVHLEEDIWKSEPGDNALYRHRIRNRRKKHQQLRKQRPVGAAWFSPDCKHFSKAKGGAPLSKKIRGLVLVMLRWAMIRTRVMFMENVEEITTWGPLLKNKKVDKRFMGRTWQAFLKILGPGIDPDHPDIPGILKILNPKKRNGENEFHVEITKDHLVRGFGYHVETKELRGCDYGAPTIRKRLFMVARCDGRPIVWPEPTHSSPENPIAGTKPWKIVAGCIDWDIPCPSIFLTKKQAKAKKIRCQRPLAKSTLRRIACGIGRYVIHAKRPFLVSLTHQGSDNRVEGIDDPMRTVTGAHRGEKGLVDPKVAAPFINEHANASSERTMPADEPMRTQCANVKGGHFAVVAPTLARDFGESIGQPADKPAPTVMPGGQGKTSIIASTLAHMAHGEVTKSGKKRGRGAVDMTEPAPTVMGSNDCAVVAGFMAQKGHLQSNSQMVKAADQPMRTQCGQAEHAVITTSLAVNTSGHPGSPVDKPGPTQATGGHQMLLAGTMVQTGYGEREGQKPRAMDVGKPLGTVVGSGKHAVIATNLTQYHSSHKNRKDGDTRNHPTDGQLPTQDTSNRFGVVAAHMTKFNTGAVGQEMTKPASTVTSGSHSEDTHGGAASVHGLVAANMVKLRGDAETHAPGHPMDEPGHAISAGGTHHALSAAYLAQHNAGGNTNPGHPATDPISSITQKGSQQQLVATSLGAYYGTEADGQASNEPLRTTTAKARFFTSAAEVVAPPMTEAMVAGARRVAKFLRSFGVEFEGEFAMVGDLVIVDIGMRMLTPRELFRAQGFPDSYIIDEAIIVNPKTGETNKIKLSKEAQIRMCGNSVCPPVAEALVRANVPELSVWKIGERERYKRMLNREREECLIAA